MSAQAALPPTPGGEGSERIATGGTTAEVSSPRRVAYIMSRFPKLTETFVLDEILELERRGIRVEVFPLWRERAEVIHPEAQAVVDRAHFLPTLDFAIATDNISALVKSPRVYLGTLARLIKGNLSSPRFLLGALAVFPKAVSFGRRMRALGVQHVHAHFASHPAAAAFVVGRLSGLPWSFTAHGSDLHREQAMLADKVEEASFAVTISKYNRAFILDCVPATADAKVRVIHCGVEPGRFERATHVGMERPRGFEFVCVGTLHEVKGQRPLIEACAGLVESGVDFRCHLVGDGPDRAALEARVHELGLGSRVVFHGALPREAVRSVFGEMDAAVAPSVPTADGRREGIPVVLMEAAATGLPLVGSRLSGIPEIVEEEQTGLLVEAGDIEALTHALARLAADPTLRERLGEAARVRVEKEFSLVANVDALVEGFFRARAGTSRTEARRESEGSQA